MATKGFGASPAGGGLAFGTPGSAPPFGAAPANPSGAFSFGSTPASAAPTLNFGAPASTAAAPTLGSFNFGAPAAATTAAAAPSLGFSFGATTTTMTTTTATPSFGLSANPAGLFGKPATDLAKPATSVSIGLGGVDTVSGTGTGGGVSGTGGDGSSGSGNAAPAPKATPLPMELATTVDAFKANVRQRKQLSSDIARCSIRPLHKVDGDADTLLRETTELCAALAAKRRTAHNLRCRAGNALPAAERAHRIAETPHGLEYESADVVAWITEVVAEGENRLVLLRRQLEAAQQQLDASQKPVTDEELSLGMRRIYESLVAVAGRLQAVHQQVEAQKAQYLSLRRNILKDPTDVFAQKKGTAVDKTLNFDWLNKTSNFANQSSSGVVSDPLTALGLSQSNRSLTSTTTGPNPFSNVGASNFGGLPFGYNKIQTTSTSGVVAPSGANTWSPLQQSSFGSPVVGTQSSFGGFAGGLSGADQSSFALQKPPVGNKRGKY